MANLIKIVTQFYAGGGYGWQEVHYFNDTTSGAPQLNNAQAAWTAAGGPLSKRRPILGNDCYIQGVRFSAPVAGAIASKIVKYNPTEQGGTWNGPSGSQNDSLATLMYDSTSTKKKIIHLRGFPDVVVIGERYVPTGNFDNLRIAYQQALISTGNVYGWPSKAPGVPGSTTPPGSVFGTVTGYTYNAMTGYVTFNCVIDTASSPVGVLAAKPTWEVRFSKLNHSYSDLNRTFVCTVTAGPPFTLTTVNQVAAGPFLSPGRFNIVVPAFLGYAAYGDVSLGERRMGRPIGRYPGRRSKRPTT
jgi:hypothetical protein